MDQIAKLLRLPGPTAFAGFLASAGISWGYAENIGLLRKIPQQYVVYANLGMFVCGAIALVWILSFPAKLARTALAGALDAHSMKQFLDALDAEEHELLYSMRAANQRSITLPITHPVAARLKQKRLLLPGRGVGHMMRWPHAIPDAVWKELGRRMVRAAD